MQQRFDTRKYSVRDFEEWQDKGELTLAAKFQRRAVWSDKARSYLMDTIVRGKPIPKIYMRQDMNPKTRRTTREIVDGQQRLRTVLSFVKDGFKISRTHNDEFGGRYFSALDQDTQRDILKYEFVVDLLQDMPDAQIHDVFARLNTYSTTLNPQELRNSKYFGEFKTAAYAIANNFFEFWGANEIFTEKQILRMGEAEFVSELLIATSVGIQAKGKVIIDRFYRENDDRFPGVQTCSQQLRQTLDTIGEMMGDTLPDSSFKATRLFYPLFCAVLHFKFGLPKMNLARPTIRVQDYPKLRIALERVDTLLARVKASEEPDFQFSTRAERKFYDAYKEHWVHAENRKVRTRYIYELMVKALRT